MTLGDVLFSEQRDLLIATLTGEIDLSNAESIADAIAETASNQARGLVLDLSALTFLDSAGIHLIFKLRERLRTRGQTLTLVIPERSPSNDALRLAGVTLHVPTYATLEAALNHG